MEEDRIEAAVQRIEQALARIADVADREPAANTEQTDASDQSDPAQSAPAMSANVMQLVNTHEALREKVLHEIDRLDEIIGALEG